MSQIDTEKIEGSEEPRNERLVDVSEAIRYRKRAQNAEQKQAQLEQSLAENKAEVERLNNNLSQMTIERQLIDKLVSAGVRDLEAAVIIGRVRLEENKNATAAEVVEQLRKEKGYLFSDQFDKLRAGTGFAAAASTKTSGVKDKLSGTTGTLERAAKKAANSGSRADLQEYLRVRRNYSR
jgi:predicted RNase H-like nuclease (RuvC/YqgF family)